MAGPMIQFKSQLGAPEPTRLNRVPSSDVSRLESGGTVCDAATPTESAREGHTF